jgi:lipase chaperone LimK
MGAPTRWVTAVVGGALAVAAWLWSGLDDANLERPQGLAGEAPKHAAAPAAGLAALSGAAPSASGPRGPEAFERWLENESSLRGVTLDGAWDVDAQGRLKPTMALRRRFDQLLSLAGEATVDEITAYIGHDVNLLAGSSAAAQVQGLWQRYVELQQYRFSVQPDMRDRGTWANALAERQQVRRRLLGEAVARAFFADEEAMLQTTIAAAPASVSFQSIDKSTLSPQAAQRLAQEDASWADWERRLADAKREQAALQAQAELSTQQRDEALLRYVAQRFSASEIIRVKALLQM